MEARISALILSIAASVFSKEPPGQCTDITRQNIPLLQRQRCNFNMKDGRLSALCNMLLEGPYVGPPGGDLQREGRNVLLMNLELESDKPVANMTVRDEPTCLSLRKMWARKREHYKGDVENYLRLNTYKGKLGPFQAEDFFYRIRRMTFNITFRRPPQVAAVICNETSPEGSCLFEVYGFMPNTFHPAFYFQHPQIKDWNTFFYQWNFGGSLIHTLNVTVVGLTRALHGVVYFLAAPAKQFICYRCAFRMLRYSRMVVNREMERISFFQTPIDFVSPHIFDNMQSIRHISLEGTRLPGIPEAIFDLAYLETFEMSHADTFTGRYFDYSPRDRSRDSNATRLILSRSKLTTLPNRAFCAFPMLEELHLDSCHLEYFSDAPFECLKHLKTLSISGNNIQSLNGKNFRGLQSLVTLDISSNKLVSFRGSYLLPTFVFLRSLSLANNSLEKLDLSPPGEILIEELNIEWNHVEVWEPPLFSRMLKLKRLSFAHNQFTHLNQQMLHDIRHVEDVDFSFNKWDCFTCDLNNLQTLLKKQPPKCSNCLTCATPLELSEYDVLNVPWRADECGPPDYYRMYVVPGLLSFMVAALLVSVAYRNRWYIMYGLLYLKVAVKGYRRQRYAGRFLWDGFVSYHASDADWVHEVLLQRLESPPMGFRLCVAERDFIPGVKITENIIRAITQSCKSLFVISREFCRSRWCMFELNLAQHRLFESDRQHGMVFIKKNDVDKSDMSTLLQYLTKTRTYVQIPPDESSETLNNLFCLQLQAALQK